MVDRYIVVHKERGQTPLMALEALRSKRPELAHVPLTYAGRLDPMADGKLLVLIGDECKQQDTYRDLDKEYVIRVLLGVSTDTGDILGLVRKGVTVPVPSISQIKEILRAETGTKVVPYPVFSSKTVNGKQLFQYALENSLDSISIPEHPETIHRIELLDVSNVSAKELEEEVATALSLVPRTDAESKRLGADFRQEAVRISWKTLFEANAQSEFVVISLRVTSGSGAYMRSLAERIGRALGTKALALSIHRTRIGRYSKLLGLWYKKYR